jgi:hypothetical protein
MSNHLPQVEDIHAPSSNVKGTSSTREIAWLGHDYSPHRSNTATLANMKLGIARYVGNRSVEPSTSTSVR